MTLQEILNLVKKGEISVGEAHDIIETITQDEFDSEERKKEFYDWK